MCVRKCGSWDETRSDQIIPCDAKRYTTTVYINVSNVESESAETEKDAITSGGKADGKLGESREPIEIRSIDRAFNLETFANCPKIRREEELEAISKTDEPPKTRDRGLEVRDSPKVEQDETRIADDGAISDAQKAQRPMLKSEEEAYTEGEWKEGNETSPLIASKTIERSAGETKAVNKKKTRFQIVSLMTDIVCCGQPEYQSKREIDSKTAESREEMSAIPTDLRIERSQIRCIERLDECGSIRGVLKDAIAPVVTEKDRPKCIFPKRLDLPRLYVDRSCQTVLKLAKEDKRAKDSTNVFPPLKHRLPKRAMGRSWLPMSVYLFI